MKQAKIHPVILSGGSGSRLWPMSRAGYPKQFLSLASESTMLQETVLRVSDSDTFYPPLMVCNEEHRFIVADQLRTINISPEKIILEPCGRNTAPAVALAALMLNKQYNDAYMLVLPSDHTILNQKAFIEAIDIAYQAAQSGKLTTFGIEPNKPETGYGYIEKGIEIEAIPSAYSLVRFVEKPDLDTAEKYISTGNFYWNSGIFMLNTTQYLQELEEHHPEILQACKDALDKEEGDLYFSRVDKDTFSSCPSDSIDYAVMEKTKNAAVVPVQMNWSDLGAWSALWEIQPKDDNGNAFVGDVLLQNTKNSYIHTEHALVAVSDLEDVIVIATDDAVLVTHRDRSQNVKNIVEQLKQDGRYEHNLHTTVHRPWGKYRGIDLGDRYQVKRITVKPGEQLSLQMHHHRAEHWIVVKGTAKVTNGEEVFLLRENESTYIPMGKVHRLENPGKIDLELIEVQSGGYLGEDDIVRFEDGYGRIQ